MVTEHEFARLCQLARLRVDDTDKERFIKKLNEVFNWIDQLREIDVTQVELRTALDDESHGRTDDKIMPGVRQDVLSNATQQKFGMFEVPKVVG